MLLRSPVSVALRYKLKVLLRDNRLGIFLILFDHGQRDIQPTTVGSTLHI